MYTGGNGHIYVSTADCVTQCCILDLSIFMFPFPRSFYLIVLYNICFCSDGIFSDLLPGVNTRHRFEHYKKKTAIMHSNNILYSGDRLFKLYYLHNNIFVSAWCNYV